MQGAMCIPIHWVFEWVPAIVSRTTFRFILRAYVLREQLKEGHPIQYVVRGDE